MHSMVHYIGGGALAGARSSGPEHVRLQPTLRTVAGHITYGCSPEYVRLQPTLGTVAAHIIYGCSPQYVRLQAHADFETAIALDPTHPDIYCHRGQLYMLQNELGKAIGDLRKVPPPATCLLPPASRLPPPASKQRSAGTRRTFPTLSPLCAGAASYAFIDAAARIYLLVTVAILTVAPLPTDCGYNCYFPWLYLLWLYSPSL